ncbi:hypothetical protein Hypma_002150 [Hypsizygus marmoreus]|uniref:Uncharacterized protein n=1 Tax=Hypsizygus marmoreus TaxID=39966 RepID=A0A369KA56_HYPMA|nr:hypothetical protein Hypma_002150 [Hypsizygus marmoreus]
MSVSWRGTPMAAACVGAITASLGAMYFMGLDTKRKEGLDSPYKRGGFGESDMRMNSSDVSAAVSVPKPGKQRLHHQTDPVPK